MQKFSEAVVRISLWVYMHKITRREIKENAGLCLGAVTKTQGKQVHMLVWGKEIKNVLNG